MSRYIVRRLLQMVPVLIIVSIVIFTVMRLLPGDPIYALVGEGSDGMSQEMHDRLAQELGLDQPIPVQYVVWLQGMLTGSWGKSFRTRRPVTEEFLQRVPYTIQLASLSLLLAVTLGVTAGVIAAVRHNTIVDSVTTAGAMAGVAVPNFWLGLMLILLFGVFFKILPTHGSVLITEDPAAALRSMVLPVVTLGTAGAASIMRYTRSSLLEVLREDYVRTARAKGLEERRVVWQHAVRNALLPVVTILGLRIGEMVSGSVVIETMFSLPGVGRLAVTSLFANDYPVVQVLVLVVTFTVLLANLLTDLCYAYLDPRIRYR